MAAAGNEIEIKFPVQRVKPPRVRVQEDRIVG